VLRNKHLKCLLPVLAVLNPGLALAQNDLVVQIRCDDDGRVGKGSGVIVSATGNILTASHVIPEGATCTASIGSTHSEPHPVTLIKRAAEPFDAALLKFDAPPLLEQSAAACPPTLEQEILTVGFHSKVVGAPARKEGIISKVEIIDGQLEITAPIIPAESGGTRHDGVSRDRKRCTFRYSWIANPVHGSRFGFERFRPAARRKLRVQGRCNYRRCAKAD